MLEVAQNILWLLLFLGVIIIIHELGHFLAARYFDVRVEAFSFGFGPRLFGFKRGETDYRVSPILIGGYVKMAGQEGSEEDASDPRSLLAKPRWQRLIISFAGPFMNLLLAVGLLTGLYMVKYQKISDADMEVLIGHVAADSPAAKAGIQEGDRIVGLDGKPNPTWDDVVLKEIPSVNRPMHVVVERKGNRFNTTVTPVLDQRSGVGYAGWDERGEIQLSSVEPNFPAAKAGLKKDDIIVALNGQPIFSTAKLREITKSSGGKPIEIEYKRHGGINTVTVQPVYAQLDGPAQWMIGVVPATKLTITTTQLSFPRALNESLRTNEKGALLWVQVMQSIVERRMSTKTLTGPIGLAQTAGQEAREGPAAYFGLMSMVSLQIALLNLLPIPILDGATILMLLIEIVMRRDLSLNVKEALFKVGFVFIMMILAFVIYNDVAKMLPQG
jgi:regulator of sigma E protease